MQIRDKYKTNSKNLILKYVKNYNHDFSAKDLYHDMVSNNDKVGLTTIYRFLEELLVSNDLKKMYNEHNEAMYRYLKKCDENNHFYLKCNKCGMLIHVDCSCIEKLFNHINSTHEFELDLRNIVITGICKNCKG